MIISFLIVGIMIGKYGMSLEQMYSFSKAFGAGEKCRLSIFFKNFPVE